MDDTESVLGKISMIAAWKAIKLKYSIAKHTVYAVHNRYEQLSVTLGPLKCGVYLNVHLSQTEITLDANFRVLGNRCGTAGSHHQRSIV